MPTNKSQVVNTTLNLLNISILPASLLALLWPHRAIKLLLQCPRKMSLFHRVYVCNKSKRHTRILVGSEAASVTGHLQSTQSRVGLRTIIQI